MIATLRIEILPPLATMIGRDILSIVINLIVLSSCISECLGKNSYGKDSFAKDTPVKNEKCKLTLIYWSMTREFYELGLGD